MLGLKTNSPMLDVVTAVKLDSRLGRVQFHHPATFRIFQAACQHKRLASVVENEVMIVSTGLRLELLDSRADARRSRKIERLAFNTGDLASGYQFIIGHRIAVCRQP